MRTKIYNFISSGFGVGYFPFFQGTVASFAVLFPIWYIKQHYETFVLINIIIFFKFISFISISKTINNLEDKDPKFVVIDEYVGQSIALIFCGQSLLEYFIAFLGFRVLDIFKPYPISYFDNQKNTYGVLMDDIFAGTIVALLYLIY